ncbi:hypothetical protein [Desulfotomaculum nigrificans]|uniref:hypothetical protein n=1 Tax=Desulfotomaculum nigrificans TaxID=1565 RepID=UPI00146FAD87|nr:hypothetical protein [Desulfotomaculum nigrificans]
MLSIQSILVTEELFPSTWLSIAFLSTRGKLTMVVAGYLLIRLEPTIRDRKVSTC